MYAARDLKYPGSGVNHILRAARFLAQARAGRYPNAMWLAELAEISIPSARRFIRSLRDDLGAPLVYSYADHGWVLVDPDWHARGM